MLHSQLSLYAAIATSSFRRYSTYTAATLAGIFTNSVFGIILSFAYLALWEQNPSAGGYQADEAVTFVWIGQALLMTIALWSGGSTDDLAERIRNGVRSCCAPLPARWWSRVVEHVAHAVRSYWLIALLWIRAAMAYPVSFWTMTVGGVLITFLDFVAIWLMFSHVDTYGGFTLREVALLYGVTSIAFRVADMLVGSVEKIGRYVRSGDLDAMMTKPVPVLVQLCADRFELRRLGQIAQGIAVFAWAAPIVDWTPQRLLVLVWRQGLRRYRSTGS